MPRTILTRPPGGASGKVRKRYAVRQKLQLLEECSRLQRSAKHSVRSAAAAMGVSHVLLVKWYQDRPRFEASLGKSKSICDGPTGQLDCIKEELLQWIFSRREQGIAVTMSHVVYKATSILSHLQEDGGGGFKDNGFTARLSAVTRFLAKFDFVYRTKTNEATKSPAEVYEEASAFMARARPSLRGPHRDPRWIWNMDQTPVYFSYHRSKTLAKRGIKTVHVRKSTSDTRRATCALTCTANDHILRKHLTTANLVFVTIPSTIRPRRPHNIQYHVHGADSGPRAAFRHRPSSHCRWRRLLLRRGGLSSILIRRALRLLRDSGALLPNGGAAHLALHGQSQVHDKWLWCGLCALTCLFYVLLRAAWSAINNNPPNQGI